ncbi:hypothetical protein [Turneriella parva]|uniref:hypothetical protein n=1 Tax=Turneriella parva TaxID=29510 RepID=UPI0003142322|nr:hypothetical protein [Turneriella parva]
MYKIALSTSAECTNPVTLIESAAGVQSDLLSTPTLAKGKIASGTYHCIMVELSKIVNTASTGACTTAQNNLICADGQDSKLINGTAVSCSGGTGNDQRVVLYYNTLSASTSGTRVLLPPTSAVDTTSGVTLGTPVVFPTNKRAAVRINKQVIQDGTCTISNPTFSISIQ